MIDTEGKTDQLFDKALQRGHAVYRVTHDALWSSQLKRNEMNATFEIHPYKLRGMWVFDDERNGLEQEPFVSGVDVIIDDFVREIPGAENGFTLVFSHRPFQGHRLQLEWERNEYGGCWYSVRERNLYGWLSPAFLRYYESPPEELFVEFRRKSA